MRFSKLYETRLWKSIFRHGYPDNDLNRALTVMSNFFLHLHPVKVSRHAIRFTTTLWLGALSLLLFIILVITGGLLMFYYIPSTKEAYYTMKDLQFTVPFGMLLRNMHRWSAHGMVAIVFLHMCRVFYTGAYKTPREFNWVIGVFLLIITLGLSFTGYLLPWDQLAFWAITVGTNIAKAIPFIGGRIRFLLLGGNVVGQNALLRFYVLHVFVLPSLLTILIAIHLWRIRKDGGLASPAREEVLKESEVPSNPSKTYGLMLLKREKSFMVDKDEEDSVMTFPNLIFREIIFVVIVLAILLVISYFFNAPLEELANPNKTPNPAKAPWYFLPLQEMVSWAPPFWGGVLFPTLTILILISIPYIDRNPKGVGVWFSRDRKLAITLFTLFVIFIITLIFIGSFCRGPGWKFYWPWEKWEIH